MKKFLIILCAVLFIQGSCAVPAVEPAPRFFSLINGLVDGVLGVVEGTLGAVLNAASTATQGTLDTLTKGAALANSAVNTALTAGKSLAANVSPAISGVGNAINQIGSTLTGLNIGDALQSANPTQAASTFQTWGQKALDALAQLMNQTALLVPAAATEMQQVHQGLTNLLNGISANLTAAAKLGTSGFLNIFSPKCLAKTCGDATVHNIHCFVNGTAEFLKNMTNASLTALKNLPFIPLVIDAVKAAATAKAAAIGKVFSLMNQTIANGTEPAIGAAAQVPSTVQAFVQNATNAINTAIGSQFPAARDNMLKFLANFTDSCLKPCLEKAAACALNTTQQAIQNVTTAANDTANKLIGALTGIKAAAIQMAADFLGKSTTQAGVVLDNVKNCSAVGANAINEDVQAMFAAINATAYQISACKANQPTCTTTLAALNATLTATITAIATKITKDSNDMRMCIVHHGAEFVVDSALFVSGVIAKILSL